MRYEPTIVTQPLKWGEPTTILSNVSGGSYNIGLAQKLDHKFPITFTGYAQIKQELVNFYAFENNPRFMYYTMLTENTDRNFEIVYHEGLYSERIYTIGSRSPTNGVVIGDDYMSMHIRTKDGEALGVGWYLSCTFSP